MNANPTYPLPRTKEEINATLDEAERQLKAGEYVTNEEVKRWIKAQLARVEEDSPKLIKKVSFGEK